VLIQTSNLHITMNRNTTVVDGPRGRPDCSTNQADQHSAVVQNGQAIAERDRCLQGQPVSLDNLTACNYLSGARIGQ